METIQPKDVEDDLFFHKETYDKEPTEWEEVAFFDEEVDLAVVSVDGYYGAVDRSGKTVIPFIYDNAMSTFKDGLLGVNKNNKWGYVDHQHNIVIPFEYDNLQTYGSKIEGLVYNRDCLLGTAGYFQNGTVIVRKGEFMSIIDKKNTPLIPFEYKNIFSSNKVSITVTKDENLVGLIDWNNEEILPFVFDHLSHLHNSNYICFGEKSDKIPIDYDPENRDLFSIKDEMILKFGLINIEGEVIVPAISHSEICVYFEEKVFCSDYINENNFIFDIKKQEKIYPPDDLKKDDTDFEGINYLREIMQMGVIDL